MNKTAHSCSGHLFRFDIKLLSYNSNQSQFVKRKPMLFKVIQGAALQQASRNFQAPCEYIYESLSCFWQRVNFNWAGEKCVGKCRVQAGSRIAIIKLNLKPRIPNLYGRFTAENLVNGILCEFLLEKEMDFSLFVSILYDPD